MNIEGEIFVGLLFGFLIGLYIGLTLFQKKLEQIRMKLKKETGE